MQSYLNESCLDCYQLHNGFDSKPFSFEIGYILATTGLESVALKSRTSWPRGGWMTRVPRKDPSLTHYLFSMLLRFRVSSNNDPLGFD